MNPRLDREYALELDKKDELAKYRSQFFIADESLLYMDGNSLGMLPKATIEKIQQITLEQWGTDLIRSWNKGWWEAPARVGDKIGQLIGAARGQTLVSDSVSINLFKLATAALQMRPGRTKIITDTFNFPSDLYVLQGISRLLSPSTSQGEGWGEGQSEGKYQIERIGSKDGDITPDLDALYAAIDENTALVTLSHVVFKSGYIYDMAEITRRAHEKGALVLWDLSHSAGSVPVALDACNADFAIGCTYKYLNGGPGSPAFLYVHKDIQEQAVSPIWGWWGQKAPFAFDLDYAPAEGVNRFLAGTQPILSMLAMEESLSPLLDAGMDALRVKSVALTDYFIALCDEILAPLGFVVGTPRDAQWRGSHVSLRHAEGYRINRCLIDEMNVIPDFRAPDNIRFGFAPLYLSFADVWETVERMRIVMEEKRYEKYPQQRAMVT